MVKTGKFTKIIIVSVPVAVFLILQSQGIGLFSKISKFEPVNMQVPAGLTTTGLVMTQSGSNVYAAWIDATGSQDIFFRASSDAGKSFDPIINLSTNGGKSVTRSIASKGSTVYVAWVDGINGNLDVFFRRSADGGKTFDRAINLSSNTGNSEFPVIDTDGPAVYVAWIDDMLGNDEIFFRSSHDAGATFGETINLSNSAGNSESPTIVARGSNVYVAWHDSTSGNFDVLFRASHDAGKTFSPTINLSNNNGNSGFAGLAAEGSNVYAAWIDETPGNQEIFFRSSNDGGVTFEQTINLSKSKAKSSFPVIDANGPLVCVAWIDATVERDEIRASCSTDGSQFHDPISTASGKDLRSIAIAVEGIDVYLAWVDAAKEVSGAEVNGMWLRASHDAGSSFSSAVNIAIGKIEDAKITAKGTNVYALWSDKKCNDEQCTSISVNTHFKRSIDRGSTFENPITLTK